MTSLLPPTTWTTGTTEVFKTGSWRSALPHYVQAPSPCHLACPTGGEIAEWIALARARDFRGAWEVLTRNNPFPAVAGRVCHHPCESACNRAALDEPLAICSLERSVGDLALAQGWRYAAPAEERAGRVAVVGAGPSGLSAAYQLRRRGWQVTLFESNAQPGGVMRHGIPAYRLPREVLDGEIQRILDLGVALRCGVPLSTPEDLERLRADHDAVYLATGAGRPKQLAQLPAQAAWLMDGADYLARSNAGTPPALGNRLLVVGGGSAALDVARSARRAGHAVTVLALESAGQLPAQAEELSQALEEGVTLVDGAMLRAVAPAAGAGLAVRCVRVRFQPGARRGEFKVEAIAGSDFVLSVDAVVPAIGQDPDLQAFTALDAAGPVLATDAWQATARPGIWAGGDLASTARFVTEAIGMGKRAALDIDRVLRGAERAPMSPAVAVTPEAIATWYHPRRARASERHLPPAQRLAGSPEVQLGLDAEAALAEAERCFSCGRCTSCDTCFQVCPDLAIERLPGGGYAVRTDYCKGCGLCVRECPSGSMIICEEMR